MTTNIYKFNGNILTSIADGSVDNTSSTLTLPGRNYSNYGEYVLQDMIWTAQHFANSNPPQNALTGQNWYDTSVDAMKVYNGNTWIAASGVVVNSIKPVTGTNLSAFWYDTVNQQMNTWNGSNWDLLGLTGSAINSDPVVNLTQPQKSDIDNIQLLDSSNVLHQATRISVGGSAIAIISKDPQYTLKPAINGFNVIVSGINLNSSIVPSNIDTTIFRSTQDNVPDVNGIRSMGSSLRKFSNIYATHGSFNNQLLINSSPNALYDFEVTGNSLLTGNIKFGNTVKFGPGSKNSPPIIINQGNLLTSPEIGAFEFDGSNLYITTSNVGVPNRRPIVLGPVNQPGSWGFIFSGTANNIIATCTPTPPITIPVNTLMTGVLAATNTSTTVSVTVNTYNPVTVLLSDGLTPPPVGSLIGGHVIQFQWNGTNWLAIADLTANGPIGGSASYLPVNGGVMTGFPVLPGDPTLPLQAAPKQYVDESVNTLNNTITTLSNTISSINLSNYLPLAGGSMTGFPVLPGNPTTALQAAPKQYVDSALSSISSSGLVSLSGSTLSGFLTLFADPQSPFNTVTKEFADTFISNASGLGSLQYVYFVGNYQNLALNGFPYNNQPLVIPLTTIKNVVIIATGGGNANSPSTSVISVVPITSYSNFYYSIVAGNSTSGTGGPSGFGIAASTHSSISQWIVRAGGGGQPNSYSIPGTGILLSGGTGTVFGSAAMGAFGTAGTPGATLLLGFG